MRRLLIALSVMGLIGCAYDPAQTTRAVDARQEYIAGLREARAKAEAMFSSLVEGQDKDSGCSLMESPLTRSRFVDALASASNTSSAQAQKDLDFVVKCVCHDLLGQIIKGVEGGYLVKGMPMVAVEYAIKGRNLRKLAERSDGTTVCEIQGESQVDGRTFYNVYYTLQLKDDMLLDWTIRYSTPSDIY